MSEPRYTKEKLEKALTSIDKVIALNIQVTEKYHQMKRSLKRIEYALITDFHFYLKRRQKEIQTELNDTYRSRAQLIKELEDVYILPHTYNFKEILEMSEITQQKDRAKLIKDNEI